MSEHTRPRDPGGEPKPATLHTRNTNQQFEDLDYADQEDFRDAQRGAVELLDDLVIYDGDTISLIAPTLTIEQAIAPTPPQGPA